MSKQGKKICQDVEDFLSRGGQVEYCDYADARLASLEELQSPVSRHYIDLDFDVYTHKQRLFNNEGFEIDNCYFYPPLPRME